jgi:hypothetical protein
MHKIDLAKHFYYGFLLTVGLLHIPEGVDCRLRFPTLPGKRRCGTLTRRDTCRPSLRDRD